MKKTIYRFVLIMIILLIAFPISLAEQGVSEKSADWGYAKSIDEQSIAWVEYNNYTMNWGDRININNWAFGNFTIELTDLMKDGTGSKIIGALMTITGKDTKTQVAIGNGESQIAGFDKPFDQEMKISAHINGEKTWNREILQPNVSVDIFLRDKPDINLSSAIYTENPEAIPDANTTDNINSNSLFYIQVSLNNLGNISLENPRLEINLSNFTIPKPEQDVQKNGMVSKYAGNSIIYDISDLNANSIRNLTIELMAPVTPMNETGNIPIILTGNDNKNVSYTFRTSEQVTIKSFIEINKDIGHYIDNAKPQVLYVGESFLTSLDIKNHGDRDIKVNLTDSIPDTFEYTDNETKSLNWSLVIPAGSSGTISYSIKPIKYKETVILPKATAIFEFGGQNYTIYSNEIEANLKGADVVLTKDITINQQNQGFINTTITVIARNLGDQRVALRINDSLPDNSSLINGTNSTDNIFLDNGGTYSYSYEISIPLQEQIVLPPAIGYFSDVITYLQKDSSSKEEFLRKVESNQPIIAIRKAEKPAVPEKPVNISKPEPAKVAPVVKQEEKTKMDVIRNYIFELIDLIIVKPEANASTHNKIILPVIKTVEETHSSFTWAVGWQSQDNLNASGGTWKVSNSPGSSVTVSFAGTDITLVFATSPDGGIASITLDGKDLQDIDMYSKVPENRIKKKISGGLENKRHTLVITVSGKT